MDLEDAINKRRSVRRYNGGTVSPEDIQKLVWSGLKVPSAGARHPLRIYTVQDKEMKQALCDAALGQKAIVDADVCLVVAADFSKTMGKYHRRGQRYVFMEAGHAGQNIALMAVSIGLGTVMIGAFRDQEVKRVLGIMEDPIYIIPVGTLNAV